MLVICIILFLVLENKGGKTILPTPYNGTIDLSTWDFSEKGNIALDGEWAFYWNRFVSYENLTQDVPNMYVDVPNNWNRYKMNGQSLPRIGYATYVLHVKTSLPADTQLGLMMDKFSSAYQLYVNDLLVASNGKIARTASQEVGQYKPQAVTFNIPAKEFDIMIRVSNYHFAKGGFTKRVLLGLGDEILNARYFTVGKAILLQGMLLITAIFFMAIYLFKREFTFSLYGACASLVGIIALDMIGEITISRIFSDVPFKYVILIWYSSSHWFIFLIILYFHEMFKTTFSHSIIWIAIFVYSVMQFIYIVTEPTFYGRFSNIVNLIDITFMLCVLISIGSAVRKGERDSWLHSTSVFIVILIYLHDILFFNHYIHHRFGELFYIGALQFVVTQVIIQARRIKFYFEDKQAAELAFLQSQIRPHFLFNMLNTFIAISRRDLAKAHQILYDLVHYLRNRFDIHTLNEFTTVEEELQMVKLYITLQKVRYEEKFEVYYYIDEQIEKVKIPKLIVQPIIENALVHGILPKEGKGKVTITILENKSYLQFIVEDNGVGINEQKKPIHGVALSNIHYRLQKLYKRGLTIQSEVGKGTIVSWTIPRKG